MENKKKIFDIPEQRTSLARQIFTNKDTDVSTTDAEFYWPTSSMRSESHLSQAAARDGVYYQIPLENDQRNPGPGVLPI